MIKVRCVTVGVTIPSWGPPLQEALERASSVGKAVSKGLQEKGYTVQTVRVATDPFESWLTWESEEDLVSKAAELHRTCKAAGVSIISIGPATTVRAAQAIPALLQACPCASASVSINSVTDLLDLQLLDAAATAMCTIASTDPLGNFRFCAAFRCRPGIPFFPAAYHDKGSTGVATVALGFENSSLAVQAFQAEATLSAASLRLTSLLTERLVPLEHLTKELTSAQGVGVLYGGMDTSLNPSLDANESLVLAYEAPSGGTTSFGGAGSLAVSEALTRAVQSVPVQRVGYCGLMLPVLEDILLAQRASSDPPTYTITDLLTYSAVCGVGLDCVPVSGSVSVSTLRAVLRDVAALACKYDKQLSCRLFVVPGGEVGDMTTFESPHLCNTRIMPIPR